MRRLSFSHPEAAALLMKQVAEFVAAVSRQDDFQLLGPSRCHGWSALDVVVHVRTGLQDLVIGTASRTENPADHDAASYWASHPDDRAEDPVAHILWLRRTASAYGRPAGAVAHLKDVARAATTAARAMPEGTVDFQGKRMSSGDFLATWVVEIAVHELDLGFGSDVPVGLPWARRTLEAVADADLPSGLDDRSAVLVGLGRVPCPTSVRLGPLFPVSL